MQHSPNPCGGSKHLHTVLVALFILKLTLRYLISQTRENTADLVQSLMIRSNHPGLWAMTSDFKVKSDATDRAAGIRQ